MDTKREIRALKHKHDVLRTALELPTDDVEPVARELLSRLQERSMTFAGPMPNDDRKEWRLKREAFEYLVIESLRRVIERGGAE